MSATQYLIDASTRHHMFIQRYAGGQAKRAIKTLTRIRREIIGRLMDEPTDFQRARLTLLLGDIDSLAAQGFGKMYADLVDELSDFAMAEAQFSKELYDQVTSVNFAMPADSALSAAVMAAPMAAPSGMRSITIEEAWKDFSAKTQAQIRQIIQDGIVLGDTTPQISRKVGEIMTTLKRRQVDTLVRTATNHASSVARSELYAANDELIEGYRWVSTLDARTTMICGSRDGEVYRRGQGPMPPAHWGCRSTTIPVVKEAFSLASGMGGERPAFGPDGAEVINSRTTYGGWLKKQPTEFVDEVLGPERSKLFRSGKIKFDQFVDTTGRVYTLDELKALNPLAFQSG